MKTTLTLDQHGVTLLHKVLRSNDQPNAQPAQTLQLTAQELQAMEDIKKQLAGNLTAGA